MKHRILPLLLCAALAMPCALPAAAETEKPAPVFANAPDITLSHTALPLAEGEQVQLTVDFDPDKYDPASLRIRVFEDDARVYVSSDLTITGYAPGEDALKLYLDGSLCAVIPVTVTENESISEENRAELERLRGIRFPDFCRRKMELLGVLPADAPRLTMDALTPLLDPDTDIRDIRAEIEALVQFPDEIDRLDPGGRSYYLDPRGNESILCSDAPLVCHTVTNDDALLVSAEFLYPDPQPLQTYPDGQENLNYMLLNGLEQTGTGTLTLHITDENGAPFADPHGIFSLCAREQYSGTMQTVQTWQADGGTYTFADLPCDLVYVLRCEDSYHGTPYYRYLIDPHSPKNFQFGAGHAVELTVQMQRRNLSDTQYPGDVNGDHKITVSDAVMLKKWLTGQQNWLAEWETADLNCDLRITAADLSLLLQRLSS